MRNQIAGLCVIVQCIWFLEFSLRSDEERKGKRKSYIARLNGRRPWRLCNKDCDSMDDNRHKANAQHSPSKGMPGEWHFAPKNLHVIPEALIYEMFGGILSSEV